MFPKSTKRSTNYTLNSRLLLVFLACSPAFAADAEPPLTPREQRMLERIDTLEQRLAALESRLAPAAPATVAAVNQPQPSATVPAPEPKAPQPVGFLSDTTFNMTLDGYYAYNFNRPVGQVNLLRAYDVLSNSFSLNQATVVIERAPDVAAGRGFGVRVDLQYGQATETLQGNPVNEPRPQVYRPVFQAYGTYVVPLGSGLTVDFGKWASALGIENNYTKDQMNYSRSYLFNFLPFYHFGFRTSYNATPWLNVNYWLVNGCSRARTSTATSRRPCCSPSNPESHGRGI